MNLKEAKNFSKLNPIQLTAFKKLKRVYKECIDSGIFFHQVLDHLYAFNGIYVKEINFKHSKDSIFYHRLKAPFINVTNAWADDYHLVHFYEEEEKD